MNRVLKEIISWILTFLIAFALAFTIRTFIYEPYRVQMSSMNPTLYENDLIMVNKFIYRFREPKRGEIVIFKPPYGDKDYIKRVIGLPGEIIEIKDGYVYINGKKLNESYIKNTTPGNLGPLKIPEGTIFVMGDNRGNSLDSREFGPIDIKSIDGRADFVFWPINHIKNLNNVKW
ncbi:MAG: signal peptidase I [Caldisericia bacterium]|jgi:signal peptidase I|nr:signal peptidase I [Caldisericia bacterium]